MPTCFVIQPFDSGEFDRRFNEVYRLALQQADLEVYRVDEDPSAEILIEAIEKNISESDICFADITTDNPNVWYELGYAFALDLPVVIVCSESRERFPFDIQHRKIIRYSSGSPSDFEKLKREVSERAKALLAKVNSSQRIANAEQGIDLADSQVIDGLGQNEFRILTVLANNTPVEGNALGMYTLQMKMKGVGVEPIEFALAYRCLEEKQYITVIEEYDPHEGETYKVVRLTELGWKWISNNRDKAVREMKSGWIE